MSTSYLDLLLSTERDGQLHTYIFVKRNYFSFHIKDFPFLRSSIPSSPACGVLISLLIRYTQTCSSNGCFILRATRLSQKLLEQVCMRQETFEIVIEEAAWSIRGSYQSIWSFPLTNAKGLSVAWPYTITPSPTRLCTKSWPYYHTWPFTELWEVFMGKRKKVEIWLFPMTKVLISTEMSKGQSDNTKNATKKSITQRLQTDLGRSVGEIQPTNWCV